MADAPEWFWEAVDQTPQSSFVTLDDVDLHYLLSLIHI